MRNSVQGIILLLVYGVISAVKDEVSVSVIEGDSVTLHTDTVIKNDDKIYWRFGKTGVSSRLVQLIEYKVTYEDSIDGRFRDRLQISDTQTGDLTIKNMRIKFSGLYEAEIDSDTGTSSKRFSVTVKESPRYTDAGASVVKSVSVMEGESVTLQTDEQTQKGDLIQWRFGDKNLLIAKGDMEDNEISVYDDDDGRFSGRLKMDKSGNLTITNIRTSNTGVYNLKIISSRETKYKTFTVSVSGAGLSSGAIAGIVISCIFSYLLVGCLAVGVYMYRYKKKSDKIVSVSEGDPVILHGARSELQTGAQIEWKFNNRVIMTGEKTEDKEINVTYSDDQQFKDRLELGDQVGYLTINKVSKEDAGLYEVNITYNKQTSRFKSHVKVTGKDPLNRLQGDMTVIEGDTVTIPGDESEVQPGVQIVWTFNNRVIITGRKTNDEGICITYNDDQQFKDRLELNPNVGSLIINKVSMKDSGYYEIMFANDEETSRTRIRFRVIVLPRTNENEPEPTAGMALLSV